MSILDKAYRFKSLLLFVLLLLLLIFLIIIILFWKGCFIDEDLIKDFHPLKFPHVFDFLARVGSLCVYLCCGLMGVCCIASLSRGTLLRRVELVFEGVFFVVVFVGASCLEYYVFLLLLGGDRSQIRLAPLSLDPPLPLGIYPSFKVNYYIEEYSAKSWSEIIHTTCLNKLQVFISENTHIWG